MSLFHAISALIDLLLWFQLEFGEECEMSVEAWSTIVRRCVRCIPALPKALCGQIVTERAVKAMMCSSYPGCVPKALCGRIVTERAVKAVMCSLCSLLARMELLAGR